MKVIGCDDAALIVSEKGEEERMWSIIGSHRSSHYIEVDPSWTSLYEVVRSKEYKVTTFKSIENEKDREEVKR